MDIKEIEALLDKLAEYKSAQDAAKLELHSAKARLIPEEIRIKLAEMDLEFQDKFETAEVNIKDLEKQIKDAVLFDGRSVKGKFYHAVFVKGRVSWDSKKLEGLMMIVPNLKDAMREGEPSVSIRSVLSS